MCKISARPQAMKRVNSALIKQILKKSVSATKAEITQATGISSTTVRSLLNELLENKEIVSLSLDKSTGGRRAERYTLNLKDNFAIAFYIGENYIDYAITDPLDEIVEDSRIEGGSQNYFDSIDKFLASIIKGNINIKIVGISAPGIVDEGTYITGKKLHEWNKYNIGERIQNKYNIPVVLENDLNSIALGFSLNLMRKIGCDDMRILNMAYIQVTKKGVGAGIITNGQLVRGNSNFAGELGFMPLNNGTYLNSILDSNQDDETYADTFARMIATVNCITNPSFIVIGGEIFRFKLIDQIKESCKQYIKNDVAPDIFIGKDSRKDCLTGIAHLTMELMYSGLKLIDNSNRIE